MEFTLLARALTRSLLALALAALLTAFHSIETAPVDAAGLPSGATLSILSQPVYIAPRSGGDFASASDGQLVRPGEVIRTGTAGVALLTFFDGSETQIAAGSEVEVTQADYSPAPRITLFQREGVTVNRVIPLPPDGSFRTDTPDAIGLVRGTSYVVSVGSEQRATAIILLTDRDGHVGQVNVVSARTGLASDVVVPLSRPGAVATTAGLSTAAGKVGKTTLTALERSARDLHDASRSWQANAHARDVLQTLAPAVQPAVVATPPDGEPVATVERVAVDVAHTAGSRRMQNAPVQSTHTDAPASNNDNNGKSDDKQKDSGSASGRETPSPVSPNARTAEPAPAAPGRAPATGGDQPNGKSNDKRDEGKRDDHHGGNAINGGSSAKGKADS